MNNSTDKTLALIPHRLISLWDMNQLVAKRFLAAWKLLEPQFEIAGANRGRIATESERTALRDALCEVEYQCRLLGLNQSHYLCGKLLDQISDMAWHHDENKRQAEMKGLPTPPMSKEVPLPVFDSVYAQLRTIFEVIHAEMDAVRLAVIWSDKAKYFEQADLLDDVPGKSFRVSASPAINGEIKAANNFLAADLNTAAVFHLMRVAEHGLYALAEHLNAKPTKPFPLAYSEWNDVIKAIDDELEKREAQTNLMTRGPTKDEETDFYAGLRHSLTFFRDKYRNPVSHLRGNYEDYETLNVYGQVREFMKRLATRVSLV